MVKNQLSQGWHSIILDYLAIKSETCLGLISIFVKKTEGDTNI